MDTSWSPIGGLGKIRDFCLYYVSEYQKSEKNSYLAYRSFAGVAAYGRLARGSEEHFGAEKKFLKTSCWDLVILTLIFVFFRPSSAPIGLFRLLPGGTDVTRWETRFGV
jgi:hypothetical protein